MRFYTRAKHGLLRFKNALTGGGSTVSLLELGAWFSANNPGGTDLSEITYFTCLKTLSESVGKMPVYLMDEDKNRIHGHETGRILRIQPNPYMTPTQLFTMLEYNRNHYGNGYAYIARDRSGRLTGLYILDPRMMQIWVNNTDEFTDRPYWYYYTDSTTGKSYWLNPEDVIHVKSWITDASGLAGKSVREILASNMAANKASQDFLTNLYQKGLTANAVVKYVGNLSKERQKVFLDGIVEQAKDNSRRLIALPVGTDIQTLDMKLTDSQFYELTKYNALKIAAAFGVEPNYLNDYSKSSYANSSAQNLSFYVNTLLYNITLYEQELNRKLLTSREQDAGMGFKFNVAVILRGDPTQQADVIQKLVQAGIYSPNDALALLDRPPCANGDVHMVNGSYVKLEDIGKAYAANTGQNGESEEGEEQGQ